MQGTLLSFSKLSKQMVGKTCHLHGQIQLLSKDWYSRLTIYATCVLQISFLDDFLTFVFEFACQ